MSHTFKQLYTALEAAQVLMNDWSDDDDENKADLIIFSPEKVYAVIDDKEVNENADRLGDILPNDVARSVKLISVVTLKV